MEFHFLELPNEGSVIHSISPPLIILSMCLPERFVIMFFALDPDIRDGREA